MVIRYRILTWPGHGADGRTMLEWILNKYDRIQAWNYFQIEKHSTAEQEIELMTYLKVDFVFTSESSGRSIRYIFRKDGEKLEQQGKKKGEGKEYKENLEEGAVYQISWKDCEKYILVKPNSR